MTKFKNILDVIKDSGLVAWGLLILGMFLYFNGYILFSGICGGFWLKSNWDILSNFVDNITE